jgi:penicillin-binding protein 1C
MHMIVKSVYKKYLIIILIIASIAFLLILRSEKFTDPHSTIIVASSGELLGAKIALDGQWRFPDVDSVPYKFEKSILSFEDRYFYKHPGFNPLSLGRAAWQNIKSRRIVSGGSTITMQTIRLSRKGKARSIVEKTIEIFLALGLEIRHSKEEILKLYASNAPFGGNVVGLETASWRYFQRSSHDLSWAEAATLAVLPNAPSLIHPGRNREKLEMKRNNLLKKLYLNATIDSLTYSLSLMEPIPQNPPDLPRAAPHLLERLHASFPGRKIVSSLDPYYQGRINQILEIRKDKLYDKQIYNTACIVIDNHTGKVIAYVGNLRNDAHPEYGGDVDIITSFRSTGSIMKPLLFAFMLERGQILPEKLVSDIPTRYKNFSPKNFDRGYDGMVPAKKALERSLNIPSVRMLSEYGVDRFHNDLRRIGLKSLTQESDHYGLSLILGGAEASLWDLAGIYSGMARTLTNYTKTNGKYSRNDFREPIVLNSQRIESNYEEEQGILGAGAIYLTFKSLLEVNRPDNETGWQEFNSTKPIAWKTGTSFGFRDAWAIGTNPDFVVAVWAGNASGEGRPGLTGIGAAAPLMFEIFNVLPGNSWFTIPFDDLEKELVCSKSGYRAGIHCPEKDSVWMTTNGLTSSVCPYHKTIHISKDGRYRVNNSCYPASDVVAKQWFILPPLQEYYFKMRDPSYRVLPPAYPGCGEPEQTMQLVYPEKGSLVYIPFEIDGTRGRMICEATHRYSGKKIYWHLNENYLGETDYIHQMPVITGKGRHVLTLVDEEGNRISSEFEIVDKDYRK